MVQVVEEMKAKGIVKPVVASLAGDVEVEEAAQYLYENGIPAYATRPRSRSEILGAKYQWARARGLL
jgi:acyl-CoA synthetase (NDP forming)